MEGLRPYIQVTTPVADVMTFIAKFELVQVAMVNYNVIRRMTFEAFEDANREKIAYLELRFSPLFMAEVHNLNLDSVVFAVCDGYAQAMESLPIHGKLIGILSRTYGADACKQELNAILSGRECGIVALDLAGDEIHYPPALFKEHFQKARDAGLHITVHAGESTNAQDVKDAILLLGAERLGHAVHAAESPEAMEMIKERAIGIESCPTSNIQTAVVSSYQQHPLPLFLKEGLLATLNTDDPAISGIDLAHEYRVASEEMGLTNADFAQLAANTLQVAFLTDEERTMLAPFE